jgi:hypothetical protein
MLTSFMAGFILYSLKAPWIWWIGYIIIMLFEVLYDLDQIEKERILKQRLKERLKK